METAQQDTRRQIDVRVENVEMSLKEFDYLTVDDAIEYLQRFKTNHPGKNLVFKVEGVQFQDYEVYALYERRLETDEEMAIRQERQRQAEVEREARDRAQYEALARRFGGQIPK